MSWQRRFRAEDVFIIASVPYMRSALHSVLPDSPSPGDVEPLHTSPASLPNQHQNNNKNLIATVKSGPALAVLLLLSPTTSLLLFKFTVLPQSCHCQPNSLYSTNTASLSCRQNGRPIGRNANANAIETPETQHSSAT